MPLVQTRGAASAQGFGEFSQPAGPPVYIEDVFSTYLYTGNGTSQTITNDIQIGNSNIVTPQNSTALPSVSNFRTNSVAFGNGLYVAIGEIITGGDRKTTAYATSPDGITWTARSSLPNAIWESIVFADGRFVAVSRYQSGSSDSIVVTSTDGLSWNSSVTGFGTTYDTRNISYGNGRYLIVGLVYDGIGYQSTNGTTWTTFTLPNDGESGYSWAGIEYGSGRYVAVGPSGTPSYSTNLSSWTSTSTITVGTIHGIAFGASKFLVVGSSGYSVSTDGINFTNYTNITSASGDGSVSFAGTRFVWASTGTVPKFNVSTDALSWTSYDTTAPSNNLVTTAQSDGAVIITSTQNGRYVGTVSSFTPSVIGKGGLVWLKSRSTNTTDHFLFDTTRGALNEINSNTTDVQASLANSLTAFNSNGFSVGSASGINTNASTYCSWTFREQAKFFDVVTYTGTGSMGATVNHNLGSVPGMIIVKRVIAAGPTSWAVYHRSLGNNKIIVLNTSAAAVTDNWWNDTTPTSSQFFLSSDPTVNASGDTYVAYLFAHNAGGFGLSGTDNVISCGTFDEVDGANAVINLGFEPQYILYKPYPVANAWVVVDNMRALSNLTFASLRPNENTQETFEGNSTRVFPTATGFEFAPNLGTTNGKYIYMAIRRPMKPPTSGTQVFSPNAQLGSDSSTGNVITTGFPVDSSWTNTRDGNNTHITDRLRSFSRASWNRIVSNSSAAEATTNAGAFGAGRPFLALDSNVGVPQGVYGSTQNIISWSFKRAPEFFDTVCYQGNGVNGRQINHNLGITPELVFIKARNSVRNWPVYPNTLASGLILNLTGGFPDYGTRFTSMSATTFGVSNDESTNDAAFNYVAYLFSTCLGVSKVGSYTGTGATQTINCGFTGGARFVLIKRTDSTGNWWVWDTARGMVSGTDPRIPINSVTAESNQNWVFTVSTGFQIVTTDDTVNASGGNYIFLAIA